MPKSAPLAGVRYKDTDNRKEQRKFYDTQRWRKLSRQYRLENPLCVDCQANGKVKEAQHVDHVIEVELRPDLGHEWSNLRSLCRRCHNARHKRGGHRPGGPEIVSKRGT